MKIEDHFDGIFHMAAVTSPPQFEEDPLQGFQVNANGTLNVLEFARRKGIGRVVLASSSAIYGDTGRVSVEDGLPHAYSNLYPVTKVVGEHWSGTILSEGRWNASPSDISTPMKGGEKARLNMPASYGASSGQYTAETGRDLR
jgi:nucleoside-diphosphate-sugar epimerase